MNLKNTLSVLLFLSLSTICTAQFLSKKQALEDFMEFQMLMEKQSSYYQLSTFDFQKRYKMLEAEIRSKDSIPVHFLAFEFEKIIAETVDRHANIRMDKFDEDDYEMYNLHFPYALSHLDGNIVLLSMNRSIKQFEYAFKDYPFLKSINGVAVHSFLDQYAYRRKKTPMPAKLTDGVRDLRDIGELYFKQGVSKMDSMRLVLTDGKNDKSLTVPLSDRKNRWFDKGNLWAKRNFRGFEREQDFDLNNLDKWLADSIGYLGIPSMASFEEMPKLDTYLENTIEKFRNAKALIVDIRGNSGGTRSILNKLAGYFVKDAQSPWVANVAYVRVDQPIDEDIESMQGRFLYNYHSDFLSDADRKAIDQFNSEFKPTNTIDKEKFSAPFYMLLHSNKNPLTCPIYILVNEECFSAASVFTAAFKGLPNVKIAGVRTNGSSGRSHYFYLKNSNIRVKLSTMLSFQRNGKTLDGNGTEPDIIIEKDEAQLLGKRDSQLEKLIEMIQKAE